MTAPGKKYIIMIIISKNSRKEVIDYMGQSGTFSNNPDNQYHGDKITRMTNQRQVILEELGKVTTHPTADELYEMVRKRLPKISLGTVYRNLEILSERGMIQKIEVGGSQKRFDANTENHYHVRCVECGSVDDVPLRPIPGLEDIFSGVSGYRLIGHRLELIGICPDCIIVDNVPLRGRKD